MRNKNILSIAIAWLLILSACTKEKTGQADCQRLQNGITTANKEEVKSVINKFISSLPSQTYSAQNLNKLVSAIGQQCGTDATVICFDCIKTLPSQSEIRISYSGTGSPVEMTLDISYTVSNKMVFHNMHD